MFTCLSCLSKVNKNDEDDYFVEFHYKEFNIEFYLLFRHAFILNLILGTTNNLIYRINVQGI